jgi:DNA-binding MarR family transcriptional regulator
MRAAPVANSKQAPAHSSKPAIREIRKMGDHPGAQALEVRILASIITKLTSRALERQLVETGLGISGLQFGVLRLLGQGQATISELSARMMLTPATLVPVVDALEHKGLARRGQNPKDRRSRPLALTPMGRDILTRVPLPAADDALTLSLAALGPADTAQLLALLRQLATHMTQDEAAVARVCAAAYLPNSGDLRWRENGAEPDGSKAAAA